MKKLLALCLIMWGLAIPALADSWEGGPFYTMPNAPNDLYKITAVTRDGDNYSMTFEQFAVRTKLTPLGGVVGATLGESIILPGDPNKYEISAITDDVVELNYLNAPVSGLVWQKN